MSFRRWAPVAVLSLLLFGSSGASHSGPGDGSPVYAHGYSDGYEQGYAHGFANGTVSGYEDGYAVGYYAGHAAGYAEGRASGFEDGYPAGYSDGYAAGHADGFEAGYDAGYSEGFQAGLAFSPPAGVPDGPHPAQACSAPYHVQGAGWDLCWQQDDLRVQGLEANRVFFQNQSVVWKMGFPFSITRYEKQLPLLGIGPFKDTLGTPHEAGRSGFGLGRLPIDSSACPRYLDFGTLVNDGRICVEEREGVNPAIALWARYDVFNYRMIQGWMFDSRGTMEPLLVLGGTLFDGDTLGAAAMNHFHHLYWRIDFDVGAPGNDVAQAFKRPDGEVPLVSTSHLRSVGQLAQSLGLASCHVAKSVTATFWCDASREAILSYEKRTFDKWRVADTVDTNLYGARKSFEFVVHSDSPPDEFSRFDVMVLQNKGDSTQLGYEVASVPTLGDDRILQYAQPTPEVVLDPVVWVAFHVYHDTRAEDGDTMTYHQAGFQVRPRDFLDGNVGERTFP